MQIAIMKRLARMLKETADKIEAGNCELSEEEASSIMSVLSHRAMSKEDACLYLRLSRSRFDDLVREGAIPRGRKRKGFKELVWYQDELDHVFR